MKYNEQTSQIIRSDIIRHYLRKNTIRKIANICNCSTKTVVKWIKIYKETKTDNRKDNMNEERILNEIKNVNLKRKKRKGIITITKKVRNYIYKKCANKTTGRKDNSSIRKVVALANKKFKLSKDPKKRLSIGKFQRFLLK